MILNGKCMVLNDALRILGPLGSHRYINIKLKYRYLLSTPLEHRHCDFVLVRLCTTLSNG